MTLALTRVDTTPVVKGLDENFNTWLQNTVDTLNQALLDLEGATLSITTVTDTTVKTQANTRYITNNATAITLTLPVRARVNTVIEIVGFGGGGWVLEPAAGQTIKVGASSASTSVASANQYDCISVVCVDKNTTWVTRNSQTAGFTIT